MGDRFENMNPVELLEEVRKLDARINNPITDDFLEGVRYEAAHQAGRWGVSSDRGKTALDWFWLIGFLSQKAATSFMRYEECLDRGSSSDERRKHLDKAKHHTISTAAALLNWNAHIAGMPLNVEEPMRPGMDPLRSENGD